MSPDSHSRKPARRGRPSQGPSRTRVGGSHRGSFSRATGTAPGHVGAKRRGGPSPAAARKSAKRAGAAPFNPQTKVNTSFMQEPPRFGVDAQGVHIPTGNTEMVLTRRQLLIGAGVVAGVAAIGAGASAYQSSQKSSTSFDTLTVASSQVITLDDCTEGKAEDAVTQAGSYKLPYGTLMWCNSDSVAVCLLPTTTAKPLVEVALFSLSSGTTTTVLSNAVNQSQGYDVYDARCSDDGMIWVEANILQGKWCVYTAPISDFSLGTPTKVDESDGSWETPSLVADGTRAYWQLQPVSSDGTTGNLAGDAQVKTVTFAAPGSPQTIYTYHGRMACNLAVGQGGVVVVPCHEDTTTYRQLTLIDSTGRVLDALTLPSAMTPQDVSYGKTGFSFAFPDIYNYGDGIAQLGTYVPCALPANGAYSSANWFRFGRTPMESAAWCGDYLMVKSTTAVCGINLSAKTYFTLSLENGCENYGDLLATEGVHDTVVTCQNVDNTEAQETGAASSDEDATYCLVRVWTPASS